MINLTFKLGRLVSDGVGPVLSGNMKWVLTLLYNAHTSVIKLQYKLITLQVFAASVSLWSHIPMKLFLNELFHRLMVFLTLLPPSNPLDLPLSFPVLCLFQSQRF